MVRVARTVLLVTILGVVVSGPAWGGSPPGFGEGLFGQRGLDPRAMSMGGAFTAVAQGPAGGYYNPAKLADLRTLHLGGFYSQPYGEGFGATYQYVSVLGTLGAQTESRLPIGIGLMWTDQRIGGIQLWDENGPSGIAEASGSVYLASAGVEIPGADGLLLGVSFKYYDARLLEGRGQGVGADIGVLGSLFLGGVAVDLGCSLMDLGGTTIHWSSLSGDTDNVIAWTVKAGVAVTVWETAVVAADVDWQDRRALSKQVLHIGIDVAPIELLHIRAGWSGTLSGGGKLALGGGIVIGGHVTVDYAYLPPAVFGASHLISVSVGL